MCDWHLEPERAYKITYKERNRVLILHVLANTEDEARAITRDVVKEIMKIEEI